MEKLVVGCKDNHLLLNVSKMKEIVVDFRRDPPTPCTLLFNGEEVKMVEQYRYLCYIIDTMLDWTVALPYVDFSCLMSFISSLSSRSRCE